MFTEPRIPCPKACGVSNRNCAYGFTFWWFGCQVNNNNLIFSKQSNENIVFAYDKSKNIFIRPWTYKNSSRIFKNVYWKIYIGWKIPYWADNKTPHRAMIANRIWFSIK